MIQRESDVYEKTELKYLLRKQVVWMCSGLNILRRWST